MIKLSNARKESSKAERELRKIKRLRWDKEEIEAAVDKCLKERQHQRPNNDIQPNLMQRGISKNIVARDSIMGVQSRESNTILQNRGSEMCKDTVQSSLSLGTMLGLSQLNSYNN